MTDSLSHFKQQILNDFNNRKSYENEFHKRAANRLVEVAKLRSNQQVLDVATGTGLVAAAAARIVGDAGRVLATDFAEGMLRQAKQKVAFLGLKNIELASADADEQEFQENQFDVILCSCAIVYFADIPQVLHRWYKALKPGGFIAFSCLAETSPTSSFLFREVVQKYGVAICNPNELLGTQQKCCRMLRSIGFENIEIAIEQFGFYLQDAEAAWNGNANSAFGLQEVHWSQQQLEQCKQEYLDAVKAAASEQDLWNDVTMFFVVGRKPHQ
ncbi:MAG: class I SAM-dependent methyltransferase [Oscillatoriales cyanobacterium RU_3_3]|nr:class I SAM-dependent methyltransferase [Oscillatoriales cyanobacterium RU_3_3]NJR21233.1 class I SAM-dependent methyltransferase [Richelia sp. CSU_2_1]